MARLSKAQKLAAEARVNFLERKAAKYDRLVEALKEALTPTLQNLENDISDLRGDLDQVEIAVSELETGLNELESADIQ